MYLKNLIQMAIFWPNKDNIGVYCFIANFHKFSTNRTNADKLGFDTLSNIDLSVFISDKSTFCSFHGYADLDDLDFMVNLLIMGGKSRRYNPPNPYLSDNAANGLTKFHFCGKWKTILLQVTFFRV